MELLNYKKDFIVQLETQGKSPNTIKNYANDLNCFVDFLESKQSLPTFNDFNTTKVMEYVGHLDRKHGSTNSRRRRLQSLRLFFDFLVSRGIFPENPVKKAPTSPKFVDIPRPTPYPEIIKLFNALHLEVDRADNQLSMLTAKRNMILLLLIYEAGLKVSELADLQWEQISRKEGNLRIIIRPPKRDAYSIPVPNFLAAYFDEYETDLAAWGVKHNLQFPQVLFNANAHRILSGGLGPRGIEIMFKDWGKQHAVEVTPKHLRQSAIFKWLNLGQADASIKDWMGVAPAYSMAPYKELLKEDPAKYFYMSLEN